MLDKDNYPKIGDYGLSRIITQPFREMSNEICTPFYRAPEMMFGAKKYSIGVDIWSFGCIMAEIYLKKPLFNVSRHNCQDIAILGKIYETIGSPTDVELSILNSFSSERVRVSLPKTITGVKLAKAIPGLCLDGEDFLNKIFRYDPNSRPPAAELLKHKYFDDVRKLVSF